MAALALLAPLPVPACAAGPLRPAPGRWPSTPGSALAERLRLPAAHALATGRGQRIAVIDTGVAPHPRLAGRLTGLATTSRAATASTTATGTAPPSPV